MAAVTVFGYRNYREYLVAIESPGGSRSGFRSQLATASRCKTAYISRVLKGDADFSLEQAERINGFLGHNAEEAHFFLLLVQYSRAGTMELKKYFESQCSKAIASQSDMKTRLGAESSVSEKSQSQYYSHWHYSAIHIALSIPELRTVGALSEYFHLPTKTVKKVLAFLCKVQMAKEQNGKYVIGSKHIHLEKASPHIHRHHTNWRLKAIQDFDSEKVQNLHYSSVVSLSSRDISRIHDLIISSMKSINHVVKDSQEQRLFGLSFDFFEVS